MSTQLNQQHSIKLLIFIFSQQAAGSLLESIISKRTEYWENCNKTLVTSTIPKNGNFCEGTFDTYVCWPHSPPGNVSVPCPSFLPWIGEGKAFIYADVGNVKRLLNETDALANRSVVPAGNKRMVHRECLENGSWRRQENSSEPWRDSSECEKEDFFKDGEDQMLRQTALRLISIVGYSLSLFSLILATLLLGVLRKLHCTRNYIHMNLFVSFILRAAAFIAKDIIQKMMYSNLPTDDLGWNSHSSSTIAVMCKFSQLCMEYFVACNYFWLLVEAIFLHMLLFTAVLTKRCLLKKYMLLGWVLNSASFCRCIPAIFFLVIYKSSQSNLSDFVANLATAFFRLKLFYHASHRTFPLILLDWTPVLFVTPWTVVKIIYENTGCWTIKNRWFWWIIRGPITLSVMVIFFIFIKILMLLLSKLKADQVKFTDYRYSLARATLVLIPLLGIHEVVFAVLIDECVEDSGRYAKHFVNLTLSSFQGFLVAVLYCFANGEVQAELKKRWQLFMFTKPFRLWPCFRGAPWKHLWKCTHEQQPRCSRRCGSYDDAAAANTTHPHLLQVSVHGGFGIGEIKGQKLKGYEAPGLDFLTRKSLSSSDGEMTLGETMEEILEESQF